MPVFELSDIDPYSEGYFSNNPEIEKKAKRFYSIIDHDKLRIKQIIEARLRREAPMYSAIGGL